MYFSLPECIPPRPLGETRVRNQWSALYYFMVYYNISYVRFKKNTNHVVIIVIIIIYASNAVVVIIINIYKQCHSCHYSKYIQEMPLLCCSCRHLRLNDVSTYGEYV
jgi:hypothetical protein